AAAEQDDLRVDEVGQGRQAAAEVPAGGCDGGAFTVFGGDDDAVELRRVVGDRPVVLRVGKHGPHDGRDARPLVEAVEVAEQPGEAAGAPQQMPVDDEPGADPPVAADVDQVGRAGVL